MAATPRTLQQKHRHLTLSTPLGTDVLVLRRMDGQEQLSTPFHLQLDALSTDPAITHDKILGQNVTVTMELANDEQRYFNGFVSQFELHGYDGQFAHYQLVVVPWLWFLSRTADCRIFQDKTAPTIVQDMFRAHGFMDFENALSGDYQTFEYVTQYRETDFDFVSRLMEEEGIYYYFRHEQDKHTLVLADDYGAHDACPGYQNIPFYPPDSDKARKEDYVWDWQTRQAVRPGVFALNAYDFTAPKKSLRTSASISRRHEFPDYEVYDYPGRYTDKGVGERYSQVRIEQRQADFAIGHGVGNVRGLLAGGLSSLTNHPGDSHNREYLITAVTHHVASDPMETGHGQGDEPYYRCEFSVIDSQTSFRPTQDTPKAVVRGPQTAIVVGKAGEDIWTDKYGRVKVQFHWDREGQSNETSSCWVRVSQLWAGKNWGGMHIPHIGQEVVVDYLEGDPDRPIITGRVYNADNMPPLELPPHQTKSIIRDYGNNQMVWEEADTKQFIRFKQDCGNMLEMDGSKGREHVELTDKFGNSVLLDSVGKMMALWSPSGSGIVLRDSIHMLTKKNWFSFGAGTTAKVQVGHQSSGYAGSKLGLTIGDNFGAYLGSKTSVSGGHAFSATYGSSISYTSGPSWSGTGDSNVNAANRNATLEGGENVWILGGNNDQALINGKSDGLTLSFSTGGLGRPEVTPPSKATLIGPATSLIANLLALGIQYSKSPQVPEKPALGDPPENKSAMDKLYKNYEGLTSGLIGGFGHMALGRLRAKAMTGQADARHGGIQPHDAPNAKIRLSELGVKLSANDEKSSISIDNNNDIELNAKGKVDIYSQDLDIQLAAKGEVVFRTATTKWQKGVIKHKNFEVG